jgi:hypothetical protein
MPVLLKVVAAGPLLSEHIIPYALKQMFLVDRREIMGRSVRNSIDSQAARLRALIPNHPRI